MHHENEKGYALLCISLCTCSRSAQVFHILSLVMPFQPWLYMIGSVIIKLLTKIANFSGFFNANFSVFTFTRLYFNDTLHAYKKQGGKINLHCFKFEIFHRSFMNQITDTGQWCYLIKT